MSLVQTASYYVIRRLLLDKQKYLKSIEIDNIWLNKKQWSEKSLFVIFNICYLTKRSIKTQSTIDKKYKDKELIIYEYLMK